MAYQEEWDFSGYEKIVESPAKWQMTEPDYRNFKKVPWIVTEKIHGANFCFVTNGLDIRCAKRKSFLEDEEEFFGHKKLLEKLDGKVKEVFEIVKAKNPDTSRIEIYGELFGGGYPHPEVKPDLSVQPVQTGVYYSPGIEFCAFDILIEESGKSSSRTYLDYDMVLNTLRNTGILCALPLFTGKYEQALSYPVGFESTIPALLGLPPLGQENKAEGIVIRPLKNIYVSTKKGKVRAMLKKKLPEFDEDARFHQAEKWSDKNIRDYRGSKEEFLKTEVQGLLTITRLNNAVSKLGRVKPGDRKKIQELFDLFVNDVLEQIKDDYENELQTLPDSERCSLISHLREQAYKFFQKVGFVF